MKSAGRRTRIVMVITVLLLSLSAIPFIRGEYPRIPPHRVPRVVYVHSSLGFEFRIFARGDRAGGYTHGTLEEIGKYDRAGQIEARYIHNMPAIANEMIWFATLGKPDIIVTFWTARVAVEEAARKNPEQQFLLIDAFTDAPNVRGIRFAEHEGSYLAGVVATRLSHTGVVGYLGGMDIPIVRRFAVAFEQGAREESSSIRVVGAYGHHFGSPDESGIASRLINEGVDVILIIGGISSIDVARQAGIRAICADADVRYLAPGTIVTCVEKYEALVVREVLEDIIACRFEGGNHVYDLASGGTRLTPFYPDDAIPEEIGRRIEDVRKEIVSGRRHVIDAMIPSP